MSKFNGFPKDFFAFYDELVDHNDRDWFADNKDRYLDSVVAPALSFIETLAPRLKKISPHFTAVPKRSGGSLMRIYRDTRFSKNKTPYKTNLGMHFRHEAGKNVHAPGFYLHYSPRESFVGCGVWCPDRDALGMIRQTLDEHGDGWKRVTRAKKFREQFDLHGDTLKRPPRGYDESHPLIVDLKRKDHVIRSTLKRKDFASPKLIDQTAALYKQAMPYVRFLCDALHVPS